MNFDSLKEKAGGLKDKAEEMKGAAAEKVDQLVAEFNEAIPTLKGLGFSIRNFHMSMGIIPEIRATLIGQLKDVNAEKVTELLEKYPDKKLLGSILKGLQSALNMKSMFETLPFKGISMDVTLGMPPNLSIDFVE